MSSMTNIPAHDRHADTRDDRVAQFLAYGFTEVQSQLLADARDGLWPVHHLKVKKALDAGASHDLAFEVFGP